MYTRSVQYLSYVTCGLYVLSHVSSRGNKGTGTVILYVIRKVLCVYNDFFSKAHGLCAPIKYRLGVYYLS